MRNNRPRRRGRPPKAVINNRYLNAKSTKIEQEQDEDSNQSSSTTNTSTSKYATRSNRRSTRLNSTQTETKKRGRKRKQKDEESEDEYYYNDYYEEPATQSDDEPPEESDPDDDDELEEELEESEDEIDDSNTKRRRPTREKAPLFLDDQEVPELVLPPSSEDLLISNRELIRALSIYEILRHFTNTLRLTPFRFEDFCVSLLIDEQTYLLSEVHIQLLKALIREDDLIGTQHGPQDVRDSINIYMYLCDHVTWPEVLKIYLSSDLKKNGSILDNCLIDSYPYVALENKLALLEYLCDEFLNTQNARDLINCEGSIEHDEHCRGCQKNGEMIVCETCPAVFHLSCLDPPLKMVPEHEWFCPICKQNQLCGVTDCVNEYEKQMARQEPIGWDRHGRQYWFLSRRIVVEDTKSEKAWYYSSRLQFDELLSCLDSEHYEKDLCKILAEIEDDIYRQMAITEKLTKTAKGSRKSYLEVVNEELFFKQSAKLKSEQNKSGENEEKLAELEAKLAVDDEDLRNNGGGVQTRLKTGTLQPRPITLDPFKNRISLYNSINTFRDEDTIIVLTDDEKSLTRIQKKTLPTAFTQTTLFKLGFEGNYRNYQNIYSLNPHALSKNQMQDDRDRKRHLSHKFSLTPISDLKWASYTQVLTELPISSPNGTKPMLINMLRQALLYFETNFPHPFMHPNWKRHRDKWIKAVSMCTEPKEFGVALYILESSMKPVLFNNSWQDSLGFTVLQRSTQLERDELKKKDKKDRGRSGGDNTENAIIDADMTVTSTSKYNPAVGPGVILVNGKLKHQIWKQKGEEYRLSGVGGWFWLNFFRVHYNQVKSDVEKDLYDSTMDGTEDDYEFINIEECFKSNESNKRKIFYPSIYNSLDSDKILSLREEMVKFEKKNVKSNPSATIGSDQKQQQQQQHKCYSPICDPSTQSQCYSPLCSTSKHKKALCDLTEPVTLKKIVRVDGQEQFAKKAASFISKGLLPPSNRFTIDKYRSIFIPLMYELRQLGRFGGLYEVSGFNYNAKINNSIWPYGLTPRPCFRTTWLYRTHCMPSLHSAALQLRVLWASVRWDDLFTKPPASGTNTITTEIDVQTIEIMNRKELPPFGLRSEYMIQKIVVPIDLPVRTREISTPNRSGLRERRRPESPQNKGPTMTQSWVPEEEIELWEIKQFSEKQIILAKQRAAQEQRQLEMKKRLEESQKQAIAKNSNCPLSSAINKNAMTKISNLIQNRTPNRTLANGNSGMSSSNQPTATITNLPFTGSTIQSASGQAIKLQTMSAKPAQQYIIRTGTQIVNSNASQVSSLLNNSGLTTNRTYIVRTPTMTSSSASSTTRPFIIPSSLNSSIIRPVNSINSNVRNSLPFITATNCPKKISTVTTANAILTTNTIKTATTMATTAVSASPLNTSTPIISTVNLGSPLTTTKNIQCLPVKTADGRTALVPISSLSGGNQTLQIAFNSNNQIRLITKQNDANDSNACKTIVMGTSNPTLILANNQKIILQANSPLKTMTPTTNVSTSPINNNNLATPPRSIIIKSPTVSTQTDPIQLNTKPSLATPIVAKVTTNMSPIPLVTATTNVTNVIESKDKIKEDSKEDLVVTSEMTQEVVRKALMNANVAPEIAQKLMALQRHHKEKADASSNPFQMNQPVRIESTHPMSHRTSSRSQRYSRSRYDSDDYICEYQHHTERRERKERDRDQYSDDNPERVCQLIIKHLLDKVEKEVKKIKHKKLVEERKHKKTIQLKLKYRQNHIEVIRRNILHRKSYFNQNIKALIEKEIETKLIKIKQTIYYNERYEKNSNSNSPIVVANSITQTQSAKKSSLCAVGNKHKLNDLNEKPVGNEHSLNQDANNWDEHQPKSKRIRLSSTNSNNGNSANKPAGETLVNNKNHHPKVTNNNQNKNLKISINNKHSPRKKEKSNTETYCFCNKPEDKAMLIACDDCEQWYHVKCVKLEEKQVDVMEKYFCPKCQPNHSINNNTSMDHSNSSIRSDDNKKSPPTSSSRRPTGTRSVGRPRGRTKQRNVFNSQNNSNQNHSIVVKHDEADDSLYCICQQKYDADQFYICCDQCNEWFHGRCVGVTCFRAENIAEYICPRCEGENSFNYKNIKNLDDDDYEELKKILKSIKTHRNSWPFLKPVDAKEVPDYYKIIKEPMDLQMIENRLAKGEYNRLAEFIYDMNKIFDNCRYYNESTSQYYYFANSLEAFFKQKIKIFMDIDHDGDGGD